MTVLLWKLLYIIGKLSFPTGLFSAEIPFLAAVVAAPIWTYNQLCIVEALMAYVVVRGQEDGLLKDDRLLTKGRFVASIRH